MKWLKFSIEKTEDNKLLNSFECKWNLDKIKPKEILKMTKEIVKRIIKEI